MSRSLCVQFASYPIPVSIYEYSGSDQVDEVFRRINSGGRQLSRQELRAAGSTGYFAQAVRHISSKIRGDDSASDNLLLNEMKKISISNKDLEYGISADSLFWIKENILEKEQVRVSRDEEIVADILAYMILDEKPPSRSEYLDDYFGPGNSLVSQQRHDRVETAIQKNTSELVIHQFETVIDVFRQSLENTDKNFAQLLFGNKPYRLPRYFQVVFLAFHKLLFEGSKEVSDYKKLVTLMENSVRDRKIVVQEGGKWGADKKIDCINSAAGLFSPAFQKTRSYDPGTVTWVTKLENILGQSYTEQAAYDFKQGFLRLDGNHTFDESSFEWILSTLVGISNIKKGVKGYVIVGIADNENTADRIKELYSVLSREHDRFSITGLEHEAVAINKSIDKYFHFIKEKIKNSEISSPLREYILRNCKPVRYFDKQLFVLEVEAQEEPSQYKGDFYERHNTDTIKVLSPDFIPFYKRFQSGL